MLYVVDTSMFSSEDFLLFLESSEYIQKMETERREFRRRNAIAQKTREEIFEISEMNENDILKMMCSDSELEENSLSASIENLFQYFTEDVSVENEGTPTRTIDREFHRPIIVDACPKKYSTVKYEPEYIRRARIRNETDKHSENDTEKTRPKSTPTIPIDSNISDHKIKLISVMKLMPKTTKLSDEDTINLSVREKISFFNKFVKKETDCQPKTMPEKLRTKIQTKGNQLEKVEIAETGSASETFYTRSVKERIKIFEQETLKNQVKEQQQCYLKETKSDKKEQYFYKSEKSKECNSEKGFERLITASHGCKSKSTSPSMSKFTASTGRVSVSSDFNFRECCSSTRVSEFNLESTKIQKNLTNVALTIKGHREKGLVLMSLNPTGYKQNGFIQETRIDVKLTQTLPKISNRRKLIRVSSVQSSKLLELRTKTESCRSASSFAGIGRRAAFKKDSFCCPSSNEWSNRENAMIEIN